MQDGKREADPTRGLLPPDPVGDAVRAVEKDQTDQIEGRRRGRPSLFVCPDCGGALWQLDEPELVLFRCHVGHIVSGTHLFRQQADAAENALWLAIRTLEDRAVLGRQLARFARNKSDLAAAQTFERRAAEAEQTFHALRGFTEQVR
jgi:two-component system chemotaxis response regulator CheB